MAVVDKHLVYALIDPRTNDVRYVGRSSNGLYRPKAHTSPSGLNSDPTPKGRWLRELRAHGLSPSIRVLEIGCPRDIDWLERYWIAHAVGMGWSLLNRTSGGQGCLGRVVSLETRARLSAIHKGKSYHPVVHSPETRAKISASNKGKPKSPAHVEKNRQSHIGLKQSPQTVAKRVAKLRGQRRSEESKAKMRAAALRRVYARS